MLTLVALAIVLALLVLSNLSFDKGSNGGFAHKSYGWPLVWHRFVSFEYGNTIGWYWSASRLAGNVAAWLLMLVATASVSEWLLRRYRPRFRWSLKTMLAVTGLLAASFAWFAAARERASLQDELIKELAWLEPSVAVERWGPQWFDLFGVDRFRRRIIAARVDVDRGGMDAAYVEMLLQRLSGLHELQSLDLHLSQLTPGVPAALSQLPQLKNLKIRAGSPAAGGEQLSHQCLLAIGKMARLERLELSGMMIKSESLTCIGGLAKLRSLAIMGAETPNGEEPLLSSLPPMPRLASLNLSYSQLQEHDLLRITTLPRLTSLSLAGAVISADGWAELSQLDFLEELEIGNSEDDDVGLAAKLESLIALSRLRTCRMRHVALRELLLSQQIPSAHLGNAYLKLENGDGLIVWDRDVERVRRALDTLREGKPGIVVDAGWNDLKWWDWPEESVWSGYDAQPEHEPAWLPTSDEPWLSATQRADFEGEGGWARFDAAGWGAEEEHSASF
jgi:hypothetical protein